MSAVPPIRVVLADDNAVIRKGLSFFLSHQADILLAGEARDGQAAVGLCEQVRPDVVLMDLFMPGMDGLSAARLIHSRWPGIRVIALSGYLDPQLVEEAFQAGASGYLLKDVSGEELVQAIHNVLDGLPTLAPEALRALVFPIPSETTGRAGWDEQPRQAPERIYNLTERELAVLALLAKGLSNAEIAARLDVSRSTVILRVKSILSRLGAANRTEAVAIAIHHHLLW